MKKDTEKENTEKDYVPLCLKIKNGFACNYNRCKMKKCLFPGD